ncbi:MAG: carbohydrate-binding family 9-like protein [Gemmatimonadota bacterium]|uniref:carbohydrate-binding family 9-like protein n=1 Tax=Candidatus Palauibacter scopulicola TaxID=3056741 RepID=UPI0023A6CF08|nr:carbohydrate-binding family 9-like protein [Candidatus Palauibacter scopulicola]MDE2664156.1 carbohydrate-binding family 9-like protein [Candidatus Palauibacter scopulicola]
MANPAGLLRAHPSRALLFALAAAGLPAAAPSAGQAPAAPHEYHALAAVSPPAIDGALDDAAWRAVPWTEPFVDIRGEGWPEPHLATRAKIVWDERFLYVGAELEEPHLWATLAERDAILYREHDFEVFLDPDGDGLAYYELEINALGTEFDLFLDKPYRRKGSADIAWDIEGLRTAVRLDGTLNDPSDEDTGWSVEIAIPWSALRPPGAPAEAAVAAPHPGDVWRVNFSRVQWPLGVEDGRYRKLREPADWSDHPEDNWVWSPQGEIDMHIPERWGVVRFVTDRDASP